MAFLGVRVDSFFVSTLLPPKLIFMQPRRSHSLLCCFPRVHLPCLASYRIMPAPAFSVVLPNKGLEEAQRMLKYLDASKYIDQHTKAVFVDLAVYNVSIALHYGMMCG